MSNENDNSGLLGDLMSDVSEVSESQTDSLTFLAWIRVKKGEQLKNPDLRDVAKVLGATAERALANGNTKVFNQIGRDATLAIYRHIANGKRIVDPDNIENLEAMLTAAKAKVAAATPVIPETPPKKPGA